MKETEYFEKIRNTFERIVNTLHTIFKKKWRVFMLMVIKRGDIFYADLRPVVGSEQGGIRPGSYCKMMREINIVQRSSVQRSQAR